MILAALVICLTPQMDQRAEISTPEDQTLAGERVRLRKLHLVRPDLIPYPISFEVYA